MWTEISIPELGATLNPVRKKFVCFEGYGTVCKLITIQIGHSRFL
jgi:hypothetical protein